VFGAAAGHAQRLGLERTGTGHLGTGHLVLGIASAATGPAILAACGLDVEAVCAEVEAIIGSTEPAPSPDVGKNEVVLTEEASAALESAARDVPDGPIGTVDLLVGVVRETTGAARALTDHGLTPERVRDAYRDLIAGITSGSVWGGNGPMKPWPASRTITVPAEIREMTDRIEELRRSKEALADAQDYEQAVTVLHAEKRLVAARAERVRELTGTITDVLGLIDEFVMAEKPSRPSTHAGT
jgi:ATP-dependent Clp protease ATP-binding subunit ClpA